MSVLSSYRLMGRFRHLRRVRGRVARYTSFALGTATIILMTIVIPLYFIGVVFRSAGDVFEGAGTKIQKLVERFITDRYEKRMSLFTINAVRYTKRIDGSKQTITTTKSDINF